MLGRAVKITASERAFSVTDWRISSCSSPAPTRSRTASGICLQTYSKISISFLWFFALQNRPICPMTKRFSRRIFFAIPDGLHRRSNISACLFRWGESYTCLFLECIRETYGGLPIGTRQIAVRDQRERISADLHDSQPDAGRLLHRGVVRVNHHFFYAGKFGGHSDHHIIRRRSVDMDDVRAALTDHLDGTEKFKYGSQDGIVKAVYRHDVFFSAILKRLILPQFFRS